jgi:multidrug efflux pump subunit AcrA (membrane-fusion protein)
MSEEVALAIGDAAEIARLRGQLEIERMQRIDLGLQLVEAQARAEKAEALAEKQAAQRQADAQTVLAEHDEVRALLIRMRMYVISHDLMIGECVAWNALKKKFDVGQVSELDAAWLKEYEARKARTT